MKRAFGLMAFAMAVCIGLPLALMPERAEREDTRLTTAEDETRQVTQAHSTDDEITIRVLHEGIVTPMSLTEYLTGVLLGEMPTDFHEEALKAQAVVCRTYTLRRRQSGKHDDADICTDSSCCQAWRDWEQYAEEDTRRVRRAIDHTDGQVLLYDGELIEATFFSSSGGRTEAAVAVWGSDIPYLQAVDSPEESPYNEDELRVPLETFRAAISGAAPDAELSGSAKDWFGDRVLTAGGGVETISIGGVTFTGTTLRRLFSLRSTVFTVEVTDDGVVFHTQGFGHRVGMSQYGAQAMAQAGKAYAEILLYYYTGVNLGTYNG